MEQPSILKAKILELEEAVIIAVRKGDFPTADMYNRELIPLLIRLIDVTRSSNSDSGSDS